MNTNPNAKRVLVYGDSFSYGWLTGYGRFAANNRFTGVLQNELGLDYEIIEEGLRGRMLDGENSFFPHRNGSQQFDSIIGSHLGIDVLILFLGTNDCNAGCNKTKDDFTQGFNKYYESLQFRSTFLGVSIPKIILICPPLVNESYLPDIFKKLFTGAEEKTKQLAQIYKTYAESHGRYFLDAGNLVKAGKEDGIHIDAKDHHILGSALADCIKSII